MKYVAFTVLICLFFSCNSMMQERLECIESYIEEYPDSALVMLQQYELRENTPFEQNAYYNLLLTQALDKTGNPLDSTLITTTLNFYETSDDSVRKSKAYYYQGRFYEESKQPKLAVKYFLRSLTTIKSINIPKKHAALCLSHLGYVNSSQGLYNKSLGYFKSAAKHFNEANDSANYLTTLLDIGYEYLYLHKCDSAEYFTVKALQTAETYQNRENIRFAIYNLGIIYSKQNKFEKALNLLLTIKDDIKPNDYTYYAALSDIYMNMKQYDKVKYYMEPFVKNNSNMYACTTGYLYLYNIAKESKDWNQALLFKEKYDLYADSIEQQLSSIELGDIQAQYANQILAHEKKIVETSKQRDEWVLGSIIFLIALLLLLLLYINKKEKEKKEQYILQLQYQIQNNMNSLVNLQQDYVQRNKKIEELSLQCQENNKAISNNEQLRKNLLKLQQKNIEENLKLANENLTLLDELKKHKTIKKESTNYYEIIILIVGFLNIPTSARALTTGELNNIEELVIRLFGPMFQSRVEAVGLSATERKLWCLLQLGFTHATIATFLCITPQSVSKAKFRMKKKIQEYVNGDIEKLYI